MLLETPRLILRKLTIDDANDLFLLDSDPEVMKYLGVQPYHEVSQTRAMIANILMQYEKNGVGRLAVIEKKTQSFIGWSGLKFIDYELNNQIKVYDLGYRFIPSKWGEGYAYEAGVATLKYGFEDLKLNVISAYCDINNVGSLKVLSNLGFKIINQFEDEGDQCFWLEINKKEFKY